MKKIWTLKGKIDCARKKGGAYVRRLLDHWKSSSYALIVLLMRRQKDLKLKKDCNKPLQDQKSLVGITRRDLKIC